MSMYSINETVTKHNRRMENEGNDYLYKKILEQYPEYYSLSLRERIKIREQVKRNNNL